MKQKIQIGIDLCELFSVREGQEFIFDRCHDLKYKIENNNLYAFFTSKQEWDKSLNDLNWFAQERVIEILNPKMPDDARKILVALQSIGCYLISKSADNTGWYAVGEESEVFIMSNPALFIWLESLSDDSIHYIADLLKESKSKKEIEAGDRVRMIGDYSNDGSYLRYYPKINTLGTVDRVDNDGTISVFWDKHTSDCNQSYWIHTEDIELI